MNKRALNIKRISGMSVIEALITLTILAFLLGICSQILIWAFNVSREQKGKGTTGNEAIKSLSWLLNDLKQTSSESLYVAEKFYNIAAPPAFIPISISFLSCEDETSTEMKYTDKITSPEWKYFILYYLCRDANNIYRYRDPNNPSVIKSYPKYLLIRRTYVNNVTYSYAFKKFIPQLLQVTDVKALCDGNTNTTVNNRIVARNIYSLELISRDHRKNSCTLKIDIRARGMRTEETKSSYVTTVIMRNTIKQPE